MSGQILIIDSDSTQLRKLRELLSREGFNIITVSDKESAIKICEKIEVEYILARTTDISSDFPETSFQNE